MLVSSATPRLIEGLKAEVSCRPGLAAWLALVVPLSVYWCRCRCRRWRPRAAGLCRLLQASPPASPARHSTQTAHPPACLLPHSLIRPPAGLQASDVVSSSLDILAELTARYGSVLPDQEGLKRALLPELDESRAGVRKRAIQCLACLATSLPAESLDDLCATGE